MNEKRCARCKEMKPITEFGKDRRNKDGLNIYCRPCKKKYNDEQKEYRRQYLKVYRENPEERQKEREYSRQYRKENKETCRKNRINYRARAKNKTGNLTLAGIQECLAFFNYECAYSGVPLTGGHHLDHVVPIATQGQNDIHNIVPCLPVVNLQKATQDLETWYPSQSFYSRERHNKIKEWTKKGEE